MKTFCCLLLIAAVPVVVSLYAQDTLAPLADPAEKLATNAPGGYASDLEVVTDAQQQALDQAKQMPAQSAALQTAITEMERAQVALAAAKNSPDKLAAAILDEQAAYQALLKAMPREFRMTRSRRSGQGQGNSSGQPDQQQTDQLDMEQQPNRYETERQAAAPQNAQQREQTQVADRLKELAQRQQDLNDRIRELQTALQTARTDQQKAEIQDQLKRLDDEQRQMLASVDDLRQQLQQSPNASSESAAQQQLEQTRTDMQRASESLQNQSASQALAAGTRAQQSMQNLREDLRKQTSSQFSDQMRQMRNGAREMTERENDIARALNSLNNGDHQSLDDAAQRDKISQQMAQQESSLTNLLAGMKDVTEQAETTEPLLSKQLYDTLRRADQMHTDNQLELGSQLVDRGFLPQADELEHSTHTNITELADRVQRAADSVLGSQADNLRYAQKELANLKRQLEQELGGGTNAPGQANAGRDGARDESNHLARAESGTAPGTAAGGTDTNGTAAANGNVPGHESSLAESNPRGQGHGQPNSSAGDQPGNRGQRPNGERGNGQPASTDNPQNGQAQGQGQGQGDTAAGNQPASNNNSPGQTPGTIPSQNGETVQNGEAASATGGAAGGGGGGGTADRLRQIAEQLGRGDRAAGGTGGGPITGNNYAAWAQQLRDVESVLDSPDLRNQLATVRDRVGAYRTAYRNGRRIPPPQAVRDQLLLPLGQVQVWVNEELARQQNSESLVPLDRDPVPENYSELVRKYYEKLGSAQ